MLPAQWLPSYHKSFATSGALGQDANLLTAISAAQGRASKAIRVGTTGNLVLKLAGGTEDTIYNVQAGETLWLQAEAIVASGTTAQNITVFW